MAKSRSLAGAGPRGRGPETIDARNCATLGGGALGENPGRRRHEHLLALVVGAGLALSLSPVGAPTLLGASPNRLINSANPYLLQHAYNPVDWYPWGEEAIAR